MLETYKNLVLDAFQRDALDAISKGESVIVAAPTGAGKTLIAEYAIEKALKEGRRVVYTAPIKALSNQKFRDFSASYPGEVGITTGDVSINPGARATIMTTEIFRNTIFDAPERLKDVATVIFDEIHYMDDPERGTVWEESLIFAPPEIKVVALSATISNLEDFAAWLRDVRGGEVRVVLERNRPIPLSINVSTPEHGIRPAADARGLKVAARATRHRTRGSRRSEERRHRDPQGWFEGLHHRLVRNLARKHELPVLFFLFSRDSCERLAVRCLEDDYFAFSADGEARRKAAVAELTRLVFAYDLDPGEPEIVKIRHLIGKGIAYHHAGLLPALKEVVEVLFTDGHVRVLFATETFALGVNMPARAVAFEGLTKWNGTSRVALKTREFQQMAGRAGRRGIDTKGDVFVTFDPTREDPRVLESVIHGRVEPIESQFNLSYATLLNLYSRLGDRIYEACAKSFVAWRSSRRPENGRPENGRPQHGSDDRRGPRDRDDRRDPRAPGGPGGRRFEHRGRETASGRPARPGGEWGDRDRPGGDFDRRAHRGRPKGGGGGRRSRPGRAEREERRSKHGRDRTPTFAERRAASAAPPPRPVVGAARYDDMVEQVDRKLAVLRELGYLDGQRLTEKGRFASLVYGHELETTELVFAGVFDRLRPEQVACVAAAVVHESRRDASPGGMDPKRALGDGYRIGTRVVRDLYERELEHGVRFPVKLLDWKLTGAVWEWANEGDFARLREFTDASDGDIVRSLRQAIQLMRLVHKPLVELARGDLVTRFQSALAAIKRGLVDAEWQLRRAAELEAERIEEQRRGVTRTAPIDPKDQPLEASDHAGSESHEGDSDDGDVPDDGDAPDDGDEPDDRDEPDEGDEPDDGDEPDPDDGDFLEDSGSGESASGEG